MLDGGLVLKSKEPRVVPLKALYQRLAFCRVAVFRWRASGNTLWAGIYDAEARRLRRAIGHRSVQESTPEGIMVEGLSGAELEEAVSGLPEWAAAINRKTLQKRRWIVFPEIRAELLAWARQDEETETTIHEIPDFDSSRQVGEAR